MDIFFSYKVKGVVQRREGLIDFKGQEAGTGISRQTIKSCIRQHLITIQT